MPCVSPDTVMGLAIAVAVMAVATPLINAVAVKSMMATPPDVPAVNAMVAVVAFTSVATPIAGALGSVQVVIELLAALLAPVPTALTAATVNVYD